MRRLKPRLGIKPADWPRRVNRQPGPCPDGWRTAPPDFVGVGVMKAGTSWWFRLITEHPDVHAGNTTTGERKELHFFDRFCDDPFTVRDTEIYATYFPRPQDRVTMCGEWTPRYMYDYWIPPLLKRAAPEAKLLVMLRDPVDRYVSGMTHDHGRGAPEHPLVAEDQFARGFYGTQIRRLLKSFGRDQILVLQYERCREQPDSELARTFRFLGLDMPDTRIDVAQRVNPTKRAKFVLHDHVRESLVDEYADDVAWLAAAFPETDLSLWPNFGP